MECSWRLLRGGDRQTDSRAVRGALRSAEGSAGETERHRCSAPLYAELSNRLDRSRALPSRPPVTWTTRLARSSKASATSPRGNSRPSNHDPREMAPLFLRYEEAQARNAFPNWRSWWLPIRLTLSFARRSRARTRRPAQSIMQSPSIARQSRSRPPIPTDGTTSPQRSRRAAARGSETGGVRGGANSIRRRAGCAQRSRRRATSRMATLPAQRPSFEKRLPSIRGTLAPTTTSATSSRSPGACDAEDRVSAARSRSRRITPTHSTGSAPSTCNWTSLPEAIALFDKALAHLARLFRGDRQSSHRFDNCPIGRLRRVNNSSRHWRAFRRKSDTTSSAESCKHFSPDYPARADLVYSPAQFRIR